MLIWLMVASKFNTQEIHKNLMKQIARVSIGESPNVQCFYEPVPAWY